MLPVLAERESAMSADKDLTRIVADVLQSHMDDWDKDASFNQQRDWMASAVIEAIDDVCEQAMRDRLILTLRLLGEPASSFAPETAEVMDRMRPVALALLRGDKQ